MKYLTVGIIALFALVCLGTQVNGELITIQANANNTVVAAKLHDVIHIQLEGNPSTGT
jgi:predicted secreted protein